jgi:hypothetical protein
VLAVAVVLHARIVRVGLGQRVEHPHSQRILRRVLNTIRVTATLQRRFLQRPSEH